MKAKLTLVLALMLALMACGKQEQKLSNDDAMIMKFIVDTYNSGMYVDYDFLEAHCSPALLERLQNDYPYEYEGVAYAVWDFRTNAQDNKSENDTTYGIITVRADGNGWYSYEFFDSGYRGINRVKASIKDNEVTFEELETVYDETLPAKK